MDGRNDNEEVAAQLNMGGYLHHASGLGHDLIVSLLLKHGADPNIIDAGGDGVTPLVLAANEGHVGVAVALLSDARVNIGQRCGVGGGHSALDLAAIGGHTDIISAIVERQPGVLNSASNETGFSALHHAAKHNAVRSIDVLVSAGADLENRDGEGCTPLRVAAICDSEAALLSLLGHGADKESKGMDELSPLLDATENRLWGIATALVTAGADVNVRNLMGGFSPLDYAVRHADGMDLARQLLQRGAIVTDSSPGGQTALHWAAWANASAIDLLVEAGANLEAKGGIDKKTPLHFAAGQGGNAAAIEALARHGADVHAQEKPPSGRTPLHIAARNCQFECSWETVDALLKAGADETRLDYQGQTPLDFLEATIDAADNNYPEAEEHTRSMLVNAPKDRAQRAWSRRSFFVLCRAHPDRVRLTDVVDEATTNPRVKEMATAAAAVDSGRGGSHCESADNFQRVMGSLMRLKEDGIFRKIVGFL